MARRYVVTGGDGFVGYHLVSALADRGDEVVAIDREPRAYRDDVEFVAGDVRDEELMTRCVAGAESVFHVASIVHTRQSRKDVVWSVNHGGSRAVLRACQAQGVARLIYVSTASAVYEGHDVENGDETMPYSSIAHAPYMASKIAAEKEILAANGQGRTLTCALRPHVVFGPRDRRFLPAIVRRSKSGTLRYAVGRVKKLSDFTYVSNLVDALLAADAKLAETGVPAGQAYFITNGEPMPFFDFVNQVLEQLGLPRTRGAVPFELAYAVAAGVEFFDTLRGGTLGSENGFSRFAVRYMCTHHYFNIEKARRDLAYSPRVSIAEGIRRTVEHLNAQGA